MPSKKPRKPAETPRLEAFEDWIEESIGTPKVAPTPDPDVKKPQQNPDS